MFLGYTNHRRSMRLPNYDYASQGVYFVTICSYRKWPVFGNIINCEMQLNQWGNVVRDEWLKTGELRDHIRLDEFVIMPNHCHGIIIINERGDAQYRCRGTARCAPTDDAPTVRQFGSMIAGSIPAVVRAFKSAVTQRINILRHSPAVPLWQRNYYERIIRNESELNRMRRYIRDNPKNWSIDKLNSIS